MVQINFAAREINCKIVYYGPGLSGKTTNLEMIHAKIPSSHRGELTSIATEGDRTLFFDFMPLDLGKIGGMTTRFQLYTVPGQVYYNATRKLVLQGVDGIIFVADSQQGKMQENIDSLRNLEENLAEYGLDLFSIPIVFQYNKRDLPNVIPVEELNRALNKFNAPYFEAVAITGEGVFPTLKKCAEQVLSNLQRQYGERVAPSAERVPVVTAVSKPKPAPSPKPAPPPPQKPKPAPPPPKQPQVAKPPPPPKPAPPPPSPKPASPPFSSRFEASEYQAVESSGFETSKPQVVEPPAPKPTPKPVPSPTSSGSAASPKPSLKKTPSLQQKPTSPPPIMKKEVPPAKVETPHPTPQKKGVSPLLLIVLLVVGIVIGLFLERFVKILGRFTGEKTPTSQKK